LHVQARQAFAADPIMMSKMAAVYDGRIDSVHMDPCCEFLEYYVLLILK